MRNIHDTPIIPHIIADRGFYNAAEEEKRLTDEQAHKLAEIAVPLLVERAERHYRESDSFYKELNDKRKDIRYTLEMYMEHWSKRLIDLHLKNKPLNWKQ